MARPEKNSVDYFPFYCDDGKKMFYIEETYGNDGFAVFVKLLRELAKTEYHYLDLSKTTTVMFLAAKCKVSKELLLKIISDLVELEKFDKVLWIENNVIWCQDFIDSIQDAYNKRNNKCITYDGLLHLLSGLGVRKQSKSKSTVPDNTQIKEEEIKEKNTLCFSFDEFWKIYPNTKGKENAKKKFDKLSEKDKGLIKSTINRFVSDIPFAGYNHPMAATYISQKRWLDYTTATTNGNESALVDFEKLADDGYGRKLSVGGCYRKLEEFMLSSTNPDVRKICLPKLIEYGEEHKRDVPEISWHETFKKYKQEALSLC